jgi:hypothetical protein
MKFFVKTIFSKKLDRYYIGSTELSPEERLSLHLSKHYGNSKPRLNRGQKLMIGNSGPTLNAAQSPKPES